MKSLILITALISGEAYSFSRDEQMLRMEEEISQFTESTKALLPSGEKLTVRLDSLDSGINAELKKDQTGPLIEILGGMVSHSQMTPDAMKLLLCHELGHYLGGPPLKSRTGWSSTEGQADYYSGLVCAKHLGFSEDELIEGALNLTSIYSDVTSEGYPDVNTCDERRVSRTNYGYPPTQCRLDTILAGWRGENRPVCWFFE